MTSPQPPLAVDLDGTLIHGDLFFEAILRFVFAAPWKLPVLVFWLLKGRAYAKMRLARATPADVGALPYNDRLIAWLHQQRAAGRTIVLATASDQHAAQAVADHVGVFDAVFASDGRINLKSARKADALAAAFPNGFAYAGNEPADMKVWRRASWAVIVNADAWLASRARRRFTIEAEFPSKLHPLAALAEAIRPQHWVKNALVFLPMLVGQGWSDGEAWTRATLAFAALSLIASSVYLINDCADIDADRRHARKRTRPLARGAIAPVWALLAALALFAGGVALGLRSGALDLLVLYAALATLYTFWLKRVTLIDVFLLASLYGLRVVLGGAASGYVASGWLLAFSCFFFLGLALLKRSVEVSTLEIGANAPRRGYVAADGDMLKIMGVSAGLIAALVLALYLQDDLVVAHYRAPFALWALPAIVVFWTCRMWLLAARGIMHDDPLVFAFRDPASWALLGLTCLAFVGAARGLPF